ncbi:allophanate hydrolase subunit 1 [Kitasatospora sp. NPDC048365]|uniref:5-oxoprolinase subunit B family protein n=1 Tax=Kitasatospora sp. NPDC048365 TaxID=3364050 RepID=UPI00371E33D4
MNETSAVRVLRCGTRAVLVEVDGLDTVARLHAALRDHPLPGITELVPAARTLLVHYDPAATDHARLAATLPRVPLGTPSTTAGDVLTVPVHYDGADLAAVAELTGVGVAEVIARHTAPLYRVAFCGFAPGFAYLTGLDPLLHLPRHATPRTRVPSGSVAVAGEFTGVYPRESPGGWQLLGRTDLTLWNPDATPPTPLTPGTGVRFTAVDTPPR